MNEVGKKFVKKPQWNHVGMTYVTVVYADEHGVLIESSPMGRSYWSRGGFEREYIEYHEPVVLTCERYVLLDNKRLDGRELYMYPSDPTKQDGWVDHIKCVGHIKVTLIDDKLSVEILP